ncbi:protein ZW2-like [Humulus lupulus]|uniref:protein ZW2-like n=1 Tax=Humulus lupulus TaxID=3486 RepID=UPI002B404047|nr:protein ZW2-like [Humulus lupulus]
MTKGLKVTSSTEGNDDNEVSFANFFQGWLVRQEQYLDELVSASDVHSDESSDDDLRQLVSRILAHYQQYYEQKSKFIERNVFLVFFPPWFTSFEKTFLWIAGFKPGLAFRLVADSIDDLSENQVLRINRLMKETKSKERTLDDELARIQESVGAPPLLENARRGGRRSLIHGEQAEDSGSDSDSAMALLKSNMEAVGTAADTLRMSTALKVMEVLEPAQSVKFLAAAAQLQLRLRSWGLE